MDAAAVQSYSCQIANTVVLSSFNEPCQGQDRRWTLTLIWSDCFHS